MIHLSVEQVARVAHEINRAYCVSIGDTSQVSWEDAPEWQRSSILAGVRFHRENPDATPEEYHNSWLAKKQEDGWVYGPVKDTNAKQHPCVLPYAQLPAEQRAKDHLFKAVVTALTIRGK